MDNYSRPKPLEQSLGLVVLEQIEMMPVDRRQAVAQRHSVVVEIELGAAVLGVSMRP